MVTTMPEPIPSYAAFDARPPVTVAATMTASAPPRVDDDLVDFGHWLLPPEQLGAGERAVRLLSVVMGPAVLLAACSLGATLLA